MSITYNDLYNMTAGIHLAFQAKTADKRLLTVKHPIKKKEQMEAQFPVNKYRLSTKENFVLTNLYINFKENVSSLSGAVQKLNTVDDKEVLRFKNEIVNYRKFLIDDINRINIEESNINVDYILSEYRAGRIKWYTFYFYMEASDEPSSSFDELSKSRINKSIIKKIERLLLYISFSDRSRKEIKKLMNDRIAI